VSADDGKNVKTLATEGLRPLFSLLERYRANQADDGCSIWEDINDLATSVDLLVHELLGI